MTNPTPPLTAATIAEYAMVRMPSHISTMDYVTIAADLRAQVESYAAQQNAELVAENESRKLLLTAAVCNEQRLHAENERLKQQLAWQPIETAPKDGTLVELYQATEPSEPKISCCFWDDYDVDGWAVNDNKHFPPLRGPEPTHYRIPQPPKEGE